MSKRDIHVVPHREGWAMRREQAQRATSTHQTQQQAIARGRELAKQDRVKLVTHRKDGTIRNSDSYGNDPNPPRDRVR